jgi:CheY-like chemotaxis protein
LKQDTQTRHFLIVENDADDAFLIRRAFQSTPNCGTAFVCRSASEAQDYCRANGMYSDRAKYQKPDAIVSDLHLGKESGVDFMKWLKTQDEFKEIPVMVLTGSASPAEMRAAKESGAVKVLRKPGKLEELKALFQTIATELCSTPQE